MKTWLLLFWSLIAVLKIGSANAFEIDQTHWLPRCETALAQGRVNLVLDWLDAHEDLTSRTENERLLAKILYSRAALLSGRLDDAERILIESYRLSQNPGETGLRGEVCLRLGHVAFAKQRSVEASTWFGEASHFADQSHDLFLKCAALINLYRLHPERSEVARQVLAILETLPAGEDSIELKLNLAHVALQQHEIAIAQKSLQLAQNDLKTARHKSEWFGYSGLLAEQQGEWRSALTLTEDAVLQSPDADLLMYWQWQRGRLLKKLAQPEAATEALRQAIKHVNAIKQNIPIFYQHGQSSYRETYMPLYREFIEQLLQESERLPSKRQPFLAEIIQVWEQLKTVELQDYFRKACDIQQKNDYFNVPERTAVLYPILLPTKMALIVQFADTLQMYPVAVSPEMVKHGVNRAINEVMSPLHGVEREINQGKKLFEWLIKPIQKALAEHRVDTILYLPDGPLRNIPLSMLSDGTRYVAERYKIVTIPGILLINAVGTSSRGSPLLTGMSKPGPVVDYLKTDEMPLLSKFTEEQDRSLRATQLKQRLELPGVSIELNKLSEMLKSDYLENEGFTLTRFKQKIIEGYSSVHIASHGYFSGDPQKSFIMTYDQLLTMTELSRIFQNEAYLEAPVDLITLSACQTAQGDDRSPLGLSGLVVQSGVKSAIGTLWPVSDRAAQAFFTDFYYQYQQLGKNKAEAMQIAQLHLMQNKEFKQPLYWAPFVLVGEWL